MDNQSVISLLQKYFSSTASEEETATLMQWLAEVEAQEFDVIIESFPNEYAQLQMMNAPFAQQLEASIDMVEAEEAQQQEVMAPVHRIHFLRTAWFRYAAAILIIFGAGAYLYVTNQQEKPVVTAVSPSPVKNDVAPGGNRATLTLADGRKIILDSAKTGELAREENATISKTGDGKIVYDANENIADKISFNTMATPRGGQYQLTLPDGSQVWLNAESSITYPTSFAEGERRVSVEGEAYFEVAKDKTKKFIVNVNNKVEVEVLGTHFNINAYENEPTINTTLIEGSVRLTPHVSRLMKSVHTSLILKPGQQGQLNPRTNNLSLAVNPNVEQAVAWKNGYFSFNRTPLTSVLKQFSRWYDVDVQYESDKSIVKQVSGEVQRSLNLSQVLNILKGLEIQYRIEGKKLIVL